MLSNFNDTGSRSSREVSPADSSSITSVIIQVTASQNQSPTHLANDATTEPSSVIATEQSLNTIVGEPLPTVGDGIAPTNSPITSNATGAHAPNQPPSDVDEALAESRIQISGSEWALIPIEDDQALTAPPMVRSGPTVRRPYAVCTKWNTPLALFRDFIQSLPDIGSGVVLIAENLPWQKYITLLSTAEAEEVRNHDIVATVEPHFDFLLGDEKTY